MRILLLLPLLLMPGPLGQNPPTSEESGPLVVISYKWNKDRKPIENAANVSYTPAPEMNSENKTFARQSRANAPAGDRDPNSGTIDARSADMDRINQQAREAEPVDGFTYLVKVQNGGSKPVQTIFWEFQFKEIANPTNVSRRQFLCSAKISPEKGRELQVFSLAGPSSVVNVKSLAKGSANQFEGAVLINRVEFVDGTFWQRQGWNVNDLKLIPKARSDTRNLPVCRSL
jgi:hypothetical protein